MGGTCYQNVILVTLPEDFCREVVYAPHSGGDCVCPDLVHICYIHRHIRVPAGRIVLATTSAAALYRLAEVLLGQRHFESSSRRNNSVSAVADDMEIANVGEE